MKETTLKITGDNVQISDGYHTFDELYEHRITLFIALCRRIASDRNRGVNPVWKSKLHSDGTSFDGWFILGINTDKGNQITYHLPLHRWDEATFEGVDIFDRAPEFDGHTSTDVLNRIKRL